MGTLINNDELRIRIRLFKAIDDLESSRSYINGHRKVLEDHGFTHLTTNNEVWHTNPNVICLLAELNDGTNEAVGGIRFELLNNSFELPLEEALIKKDPRVKSFTRSYPEYKSAEMCGLWNSKKVAGKKLSLILGRSALSVAPLLGLENVFIFIAKYTMEYSKRLGFQIIRTIGEDGDFKYPTEHFIANVLVNSDLISLHDAAVNDKNIILEIRRNLSMECIEIEDDVKVNVVYALDKVNTMDL